jgi:hypothetical protein
MRVCPLFPAPHLYPSDSTRQHPRRAGIRGLRHKLRHKNPLGAFVRCQLLGGLGADSPQRGAGTGPALGARSAAGVWLPLRLPSLALREAQGGGSASRCAGLVPPAHLARRAVLRRALWGEPARLARGRFAPGLRCAGHLCLRAGWPFAWRCWVRPRGPACFIGGGRAAPRAPWPGCLPARRM